MKRHKKRKKRATRNVVSSAQPRGFDYGCLPYAMAVGSVDFPSHLSAASVGAVAYGSAWSEEIGKTVPTIALVAQDGDELAKSFDTFNAWSKATDPDSLEITFVFRKSGGYVLAISAEYLRLQRRCLGFDRTHRPMVFAATWLKPIDHGSPLLLNFRKHCSQPIAPFLFDGVVYASPRSTLSPLSFADLHRIPGLQPLLKFEAEFIDEDQVIPDTVGWLALNTGAMQIPKSPTGPPRPDLGDIAKQRVKALRGHFPITLERMRRSSAMQDIVGYLSSVGVVAWQIEQAICNLVLSTEMGCGRHYVGLSSREADESILKALRSRYEIADGGDIPAFAWEEVRTQVIADGNALLRYVGEKPAEDLATVQAAIRSTSALEATSAIGDPPAQRVATR